MTIDLVEYTGPAETWDSLCSAFRTGHLLQSFGWGEVKRLSGWKPFRLTANLSGRTVAAIQVLVKGIRGLGFAYVPRGPAMDDLDLLSHVLSALEAFCRSLGACCLQVDLPVPGSPELLPRGWKKAKPIQPQATLVVELTDPDEMLSRMRPKTRYNIRLAMRKGVEVKARYDAEAMETFYALLEETARRDGFGIHPLSYYMEFWKQFVVRDLAAVLIAEAQNRVLAGLVVARWEMDAYYLYGGSATYGRDMMPSYLLQWAAMGWARQKGCRYYDLWGIPAEASPDLSQEEAERRRRQEGGLWGVYRFKSGFGGVLRSYVGVRRYLNALGPLLLAAEGLR